MGGEVEEKENKTDDAKAINHYLPGVDQCPVPKQKMASLSNPIPVPLYCRECCSMAWGISLVSSGHLPRFVLSQPLAHPAVY